MIRLRSVLIAGCIWKIAGGWAWAQAGEVPDAASTPGQDLGLDELIVMLDGRTAEVEDASARFEQKKFTAILKKPLVSTGFVKVKGARSLWVTEEPRRSVIVTGADEVRVHYPEEKLLEIYPLEGRPGGWAVSPLTRLSALRKDFEIRRLPDEEARKPREDGRPIRLRLTPMTEALQEQLKEVRISFDPESAIVNQVTIIDTDADRTVIKFSETALNRGLEDRVFELNVPDGTTVLHPLSKADGGDSESLGDRRGNDPE